jgi:hypothetical protein
MKNTLQEKEQIIRLLHEVMSVMMIMMYGFMYICIHAALAYRAQLGAILSQKSISNLRVSLVVFVAHKFPLWRALF